MFLDVKEAVYSTDRGIRVKQEGGMVQANTFQGAKCGGLCAGLSTLLCSAHWRNRACEV